MYIHTRKHARTHTSTHTSTHTHTHTHTGGLSHVEVDAAPGPKVVREGRVHGRGHDAGIPLLTEAPG
jgi:hypothetical protein